MGFLIHRLNCRLHACICLDFLRILHISCEYVECNFNGLNTSNLLNINYYLKLDKYINMDIIDKRIYSCNKVICKNIESLQANERGLLSQNILSQLRNFLESVFLKIYVTSGNLLIENEYQNIKKAINYINTLQGKYRFFEPIS